MKSSLQRLNEIKVDFSVSFKTSQWFALQGNFDRAVEIVQPVYSKIVTMGGSNAQVSHTIYS